MDILDEIKVGVIIFLVCANIVTGIALKHYMGIYSLEHDKVTQLTQANVLEKSAAVACSASVTEYQAKMEDAAKIYSSNLAAVQAKVDTHWKNATTILLAPSTGDSCKDVSNLLVNYANTRKVSK